MNGKTVNHGSLTPIVLQLLSSRDGIMLMKSVQQQMGTCILFDRQNLTIRIFGPENQAALTEQKLVASLLAFRDKQQTEVEPCRMILWRRWWRSLVLNCLGSKRSSLRLNLCLIQVDMLSLLLEKRIWDLEWRRWFITMHGLSVLIDLPNDMKVITLPALFACMSLRTVTSFRLVSTNSASHAWLETGQKLVFCFLDQKTYFQLKTPEKQHTQLNKPTCVSKKQKINPRP